VAVELDVVVAELLSRSGAQAARVVDARTGTALAAAGTGAGDEVATLVQLARDAAPMALAGGGMEDLVLATRNAVHVLRSVAGVFLHVRVDSEHDAELARRELASPALHRALGAAPAPGPALPRPRTSVDGRDSRPALAGLAENPSVGGAARAGAGRHAGRRPGAGSLAVLAIDAPAQLPQRAPTRPVPAPTVLNQEWSRDVATLQRLVAGLQRLN